MESWKVLLTFDGLWSKYRMWPFKFNLFASTLIWYSGCKENQFYSLPFGQAEASIYWPRTSFQLAPKAFWPAEFLKTHHLPVGQVKNRIHQYSPIAKSTSPGLPDTTFFARWVLLFIISVITKFGNLVQFLLWWLFGMRGLRKSMEISHVNVYVDIGLEGLMAMLGEMESLISPDQLIIIKCRSSAMVFTSQMRSEQKWTCLFNNMQVLKINHFAHQN